MLAVVGGMVDAHNILIGKPRRKTTSSHTYF